jgi:hypothetical protein
MKSRRRITRRLRAATLGLAAFAALAALAAAEPGTDYPQPSSVKIGDTPADFARPVAPAPKLGDTPADHPGASRAPDYQAPNTIQVVRPERTIVRNTDQTLPMILAGLALLVALASAGYPVARARALRRRVAH